MYINGRDLGEIYYRGRASRECATCRRVKPYAMFKQKSGVCRRCMLDAESVRRAERWQQDEDEDSLYDAETLADPLDQMFDDANRFSATRQYRHKVAQEERLLLAQDVLRDLD